jgi:hypothetical protein
VFSGSEIDREELCERHPDPSYVVIEGDRLSTKQRYQGDRRKVCVIESHDLGCVLASDPTAGVRSGLKYRDDDYETPSASAFNSRHPLSLRNFLSLSPSLMN